MLANSEKIVIEIRDRLRSNRIVDSRLLTRHIDYDIDYLAGTLRFREPILSRSSSGDPQFIVADYEVDGVADRKLERRRPRRAGAAPTRRCRSPRPRSTTRRRPPHRPWRRRRPLSPDRRDRIARRGGGQPHARRSRRPRTATAWQVEAEHHAGNIDLLAYARQRGDGFGLGQTNAGENGTRKFGFDGRAQARPQTCRSAGSAWHEDYLDSGATRTAGRALVEYRGLDP